jgi:glucose dehydrogenase
MSAHGGSDQLPPRLLRSAVASAKAEDLALPYHLIESCVMRIGRDVIVSVTVVVFVAHFVSAQQPRNPDWEWPTYNRDLAGTRYSPLTQINTKNVSRLVQTWSYRLRPEPGRSVEEREGVA